MRRIKRVAILMPALLVAGVLAAGCASIMKGTKQQVTINSTPTAASVVIKTVGGVKTWEGATPAIVKLSKKREYVVTVSMEGYADADANIMKEGIEGWFWGNILCGGIIGIIVDVTNGAINKLQPDEISIQLVTAALPGGEDQFYAIFQALDSKGQLRSFAVPMTKANQTEFLSAGD